MSKVEVIVSSMPAKNIDVGLDIGCGQCVLPVGYAGASFSEIDGESSCNFCLDHEEPNFLGGEKLIQDLNLVPDEQVGVMVSGGKDSLYAWMWFVDKLGPDKVVGFNHNKIGLTHPLAEGNLIRAAKILGSQLIRVNDSEMLPRFQKNLSVLLEKPDEAMVRVALCAGCRHGISGVLFAEGEKMGITKYISAASYLELAPFKGAVMQLKGDGDEREGLLVGLKENSGYDHGDNVKVIMREDDHCHKGQLTAGGSYDLYPGIVYFDFDNYFPNIPEKTEELVKERLGWERPERSWHFDCEIETFKDLFYYGLLGYTETDYNLSAQIRFGLIERDEAIARLLKARKGIINSRPEVFDLMKRLGVEALIPKVDKFYCESLFLSEQVR